MSKCFNPDCLFEDNLPDNNYCIKCGNKLLLMEHYRGIKYLGEGGFGRTFVGIDQARRNTPCVIKQFLPLSQGTDALQKCVELFEQEAELLDKLGKYPQIPDLLAFFTQEGRLYLIQQFIEGDDLFTELHQKFYFSEDEVKSFLIEMLPVLDFIHNKNVIHRDIKPENIIRRKRTLDPAIYGKVSDLVLIDFGISKQVSATVITKLGTHIGTPGYSPPEQNRGIVKPASDIYSLGVTAIRLFTGVIPIEKSGGMKDDIFDVNDLRWIWQEYLSNQKIVVNKNFAQILDKMLADKISDRFQSASDVLAALTSSHQVPSFSNSQQNSPLHQRVGVIKVPKIEYNKLEQFLKIACDDTKSTSIMIEKCQAANQETADIMLKIMGRENDGYLTEENCKKFPREELKILDNLWVKYSNGKFGFSVQKKIWISLGGIPGVYDDNLYLQFANRVDWFFDWGKWSSYSDLKYYLPNAKPGHFPFVAGVLLGGVSNQLIVDIFGV